MTVKERTTSKLAESTKRKLSLLELAGELDNVSKTCQLIGYHRDSFYEIRRAFEVGGVAALIEQRRGPRGPRPNRVAPEIEEKIRAYALERPTHGAQRVANELRLQGFDVSPSGTRGVWPRHGLETRTKRLLRLEREAQKDTIVLSEEQVQLLERHSADLHCRHIEVSRPGDSQRPGVGEILNLYTPLYGVISASRLTAISLLNETLRHSPFPRNSGRIRPHQ